MHAGGTGAHTLARVLAIAIAIGVMTVAVVLGDRLFSGDDAPAYPAARPMALPGEPIPAESRYYHSRPRELAALPDADPRAGTGRLPLAMSRQLRAYPGAPPRVPHGLTDEEFRKTLCNTCHLRGGYVPRFEAYAPVTPHPEYVACLQCHMVDDNVVGIGFPVAGRDATCLQCHSPDPDRATPLLTLVDWPALEWPEKGQRAMEGGPLLIPHGLQLRENCVACHVGPGAPAEIRTTHPERVDCRQCHVPVGDRDEVFIRPAAPAEGVVEQGSPTGGGP